MSSDFSKILKSYFADKPVYKAYLFGSVVRDDFNEHSDIDILIELDYKNGGGYFTFFNMQNELSNLLQRKVDLVSANGLSVHIKPVIDHEKMLVYERN